MTKIAVVALLMVAAGLCGCGAEDTTPAGGAVYPIDGPVGTTTTSTPSVAVCSCASDFYSCTSFNTRSKAQACYDYCQALGAGDIHGLDADNDGKACE